MIEPKRIRKKDKTTLKVSEGGGAESSQDNPVLEKHYTDRLYELLGRRYEFRYNTIWDCCEYKSKEEEDYKLVKSKDQRTFKVFARRCNFKANNKEVTLEDIQDIIESGFFVPEVHPLQQYLSGLKWDGKDHIKNLASCLKFIDDKEFEVNGISQSKLFQSIFKRWLINSCAIVMQKPGAGNGHVMIILEGAQYGGKTTFINSLVPKHLQRQYGWSGHINVKIRDTDASNMLVQRWLVHIDDQWNSLKPEEMEIAKAFITADNVPDRVRYQTYTDNKTRVASFMASVNGREIFTDQENRRYVVFCLDGSSGFALDLPKLQKIDINQVWAQAMKLLNKEPYLYTEEERKQIRIKNESFRKIIIEQEALTSLYIEVEESDPDRHYLQLTELMASCNKVLKLNFTVHNFQKALAALNYKPLYRKINGSSRKVYCVKWIGDSNDPDKIGYNPDKFAEVEEQELPF